MFIQMNFFLFRYIHINFEIIGDFPDLSLIFVKIFLI